MEKNTGIYSVSWKNFSTALIHNLTKFLKKESYCDATIICESRHIKVHRLILSSCSEYFKEIFDNIVCSHPFIILKDIGLIELEALLDFMYEGKTNIFKNRIKKLFDAAEFLKIKGLGVPDSELQSSPIISTINNAELGFHNMVCDENVPTSSVNKDSEQKKTETKCKRKNSKDSPSFIQSKKLKESPSRIRQVMYKKFATIMEEKCNTGSQNHIAPKVSYMDDESNKSNKIKPVVVLDRNVESQVFNNTTLSCKESFVQENQNVNLVSDVEDSGNHLTLPESSFSSLSNESYCLDTNYYKCPDCTFGAKSPTELVTHRKVHVNVAKPFNCGYCSYSTFKKELLQKHIKIHNKTAKPFKCKKCPFRTSLNISLKKHKEKSCKEKVVKVKETLSCDTANKNISSDYQSMTASNNFPLDSQGKNVFPSYQDLTAKNFSPSGFHGTSFSSNYQEVTSKNNSSSGYENTSSNKNLTLSYQSTLMKSSIPSGTKDTTASKAFPSSYQTTSASKTFPSYQGTFAKNNTLSGCESTDTNASFPLTSRNASAKSTKDVGITHRDSFEGQLESSKCITTQSKLDNSGSLSQDYLSDTDPHLDETANIAHIRDLDKTSKYNQSQSIHEKYVCAFCPHETNRKSLLASHVAMNHQDL